MEQVGQIPAGTSLRAWLFTILRNIYYSNYRKRAREVQDSDGAYARRLVVIGDQESHLDLEDFRKALAKLPAEQREVLTLVGPSAGRSNEKGSKHGATAARLPAPAFVVSPQAKKAERAMPEGTNSLSSSRTA